MCILIDSCTLSSVFNPNSKNHADFAAVFNWILSGDGHIILGGSKYGKELAKVASVLKFIANLEAVGKVVKIPKATVDSLEKEIDARTPATFNDAHLAAIIQASRCKLLCSVNTKDFGVLLDRTTYKSPCKPPKIYKSARNASLLKARYVADVCKPSKKLTKRQVAALSG